MLALLDCFRRKSLIPNLIVKAAVLVTFVLLFSGCGDDGNGAGNLALADIIIVVDNSGDMNSVIEGLQDNLNAAFAQQLTDAALDFRIILVSEYGMLNDESVCIASPLSGIVNCTSPPIEPVNSNRFSHFSTAISSNDPLCKILETLVSPDEFNLFPNGWVELLRTEASKYFMVFTNDGVDCFSGIALDDLNSAVGGTAAAGAFNGALTSQSPSQFGTAASPNYVFISMIATPGKDVNDPAVPYVPSDAITTLECNIAAQPGTGYQGLSRLTDGSRYSLCDPDDYAVIFNAAAQEIVNASAD